MENKKLYLFGFSMLFLLVLAGFASATTNLSIGSTSLIFNHLSNVQTLTVTGNTGDSISLPSDISTDGKAVATLSYYLGGSTSNDTVTGSSIQTLVLSNATTGCVNNSPSAGLTTCTLYIQATPGTYFALGGSAIISDTTNSSTASFSVSFSGHLSLSIDSTKVTSGYGDDTNWYPLDSIEAKVDVTNDGSDKMNSIVVSYGLYDTDHNKWVVKGQSSSFSLNDGNDKEVTLDFNLSSSSLDSNNGNQYQFYVWATGKDYSYTTADKTSSSTSLTDVSVNFDSDFVVLSNAEVTQTPVACGTTAEITGSVINIGSDDQSNVYVKVYNSDLGINQKINVGDINSLDSAPLDFTFNVPSSINEGTYNVQLAVYDSSGDVYTNSNNHISSISIPVTVSGSCVYNSKLTMTSAVQAGGNPGEELDVVATIANTDTKARTFAVTASDFSNWADLISVSPTLLTLNPSETKQVTLKFNVKNGVSGAQNFNVQLTENGKIIPEPVSVNITNPASGFTNFINSLFKGNGYLWAIGALNVLLIVIIIVVAVRVSRKK